MDLNVHFPKSEIFYKRSLNYFIYGESILQEVFKATFIRVYTPSNLQHFG